LRPALQPPDLQRLHESASRRRLRGLLAQQPGLPYCQHCFGTRVVVVDQKFRDRFKGELLQINFESDGRISTTELYVGRVPTLQELAAEAERLLPSP
jgi:hypothetical protein